MENAVYDGASGMYTEGYIADNILALHPTARTVENDPEILNNTVTDVRTYTASDDRNVKSADGKRGITIRVQTEKDMYRKRTRLLFSEAISILTTFRKTGSI